MIRQMTALSIWPVSTVWVLLAFSAATISKAATLPQQSGNYSAGNCPVITLRNENGTTYWNIRNACDATITVFYVAVNPAPGDNRAGNAHLEPGETDETYLSGKARIETYACLTPHRPVDENGNSPTHPVSGFTCR